MQQPGKTAGSGNWLPEAGIPRPHVVMLTKLMIQTSAAFVLASNRLGGIQAIELGVAGEVRRRKQLLRVIDHVLVDHAGRNFVARRARTLNISGRWERVAARVTHERLTTVRVVNLSGDAGEVAAELRRGWRGVEVGSPGVVSKALVAQEEKRFLLMLAGNGKWTAESRAKLILLELGLKAGLDQRIRASRILVAQNIPCRPWNCAVPDLVTTLTTPPITPPNDASSLWMPL